MDYIINQIEDNKTLRADPNTELHLSIVRSFEKISKCDNCSVVIEPPQYVYFIFLLNTKKIPWSCRCASTIPREILPEAVTLFAVRMFYRSIQKEELEEFKQFINSYYTAIDGERFRNSIKVFEKKYNREHDYQHCQMIERMRIIETLYVERCSQNIKGTE